MLLTEKQLDIFREIINIGMGKSAAMLNEILEAPIKLEVPRIDVLRGSDLAGLADAEAKLSAIKLNFSGLFSGFAHLVFPVQSAGNLVSLLTNERNISDEMDSIKAGTLSEIGNILLNGILGSISNMTETQFNYSIPVYMEDKMANLLRIDDLDGDTILLLSHTKFDVHSLEIYGEILILLGLDSFEKLKETLEKLSEE